MKEYKGRRCTAPLTLNLFYEVSGQPHAPAFLPPGKEELLYPLKAGWPQSRFICFGEDINLLPLPDFESPVVQPAAKQLYECLHYRIYWNDCWNIEVCKVYCLSSSVLGCKVCMIYLI